MRDRLNPDQCFREMREAALRILSKHLTDALLTTPPDARKELCDVVEQRVVLLGRVDERKGFFHP